MTSYTVASDASFLLELLKASPAAMEAIATSCHPKLVSTPAHPAFYATLDGRKAALYTTNNHHPADPRTNRVFQLWLENGALRWRWVSPYTTHKRSAKRDIVEVLRVQRVIITEGRKLNGISGEVVLAMTPSSRERHSTPLAYIPGD